jgi:hypothetical protein
MPTLGSDRRQTVFVYFKSNDFGLSVTGHVVWRVNLQASPKTPSGTTWRFSRADQNHVIATVMHSGLSCLAAFDKNWQTHLKQDRSTRAPGEWLRLYPPVVVQDGDQELIVVLLTTSPARRR